MHKLFKHGKLRIHKKIKIKYFWLFLILFFFLGLLIILYTPNNLPYRSPEIKNNPNLINYQNEAILAKLYKDTMTINSWKYYKKTFISDDGRVIDYQRGSISTSEGQAYAMRRALIMRDKETFDKVYNWAKYNLQHKNNHLFAWLWGPRIENHQGEVKYEILDQNGASDAGVEIAACLILASRVWGQTSYKNDALEILNDIWNKETIEIKGERILTAGINQAKEINAEINPSYFMPYTFRIFAKFDKTHDWQKLVDSSYRLTDWCIDHTESGLPPDIFYINKGTGAIIFDEDKSNFSYDAVRIFYRFYVDYALTKDHRAENLLSKSKFFINRWQTERVFYTSYLQNGKIENYDEAIGSIAIMLPAIKLYNKKVAHDIYQERVKDHYHREGYWNDPLDYYAQNLVWFGNWLYQDEKNAQFFKY